MRLAFALLIMLLGVVGLVGCAQWPPHDERVDVGVIKSARVVPTSFNEAPKTEITTEKRVIVVFGLQSIPLNETGYLVTGADRYLYFCWSNQRRNERCPTVIL